jgi:hypothetical protein
VADRFQSERRMGRRAERIAVNDHLSTRPTRYHVALLDLFRQAALGERAP